MSPDAYDFIDKLLCMDPAKRLGSNGIDEIKKHPFFKDINWDKVLDMEPPFKPDGKDLDAQFFPKANEQDEDI